MVADIEMADRPHDDPDYMEDAIQNMIDDCRRFGRDVVAEIPVLIFFLAACAVLLAAAIGVPTTIVAP